MNDLLLFMKGGVFPTTILASYEALPVSPPFSCVLLSRIPLLA